MIKLQTKQQQIMYYNLFYYNFFNAKKKVESYLYPKKIKYMTLLKLFYFMEREK